MAQVMKRDADALASSKGDSSDGRVYVCDATHFLKVHCRHLCSALMTLFCTDLTLAKQHHCGLHAQLARAERTMCT